MAFVAQSARLGVNLAQMTVTIAYHVQLDISMELLVSVGIALAEKAKTMILALLQSALPTVQQNVLSLAIQLATPAKEAALPTA